MPTMEKVKDKLKKLSNYLIIFLVIFLAFSLARNAFKLYEVKGQIKKTKERTLALKKENEELQKRLSETQSSVYIERELRDKLGLAKIGETVVVLPDTEILKRLAPKSSDEEDFLPDPTWKKWLKLFF